MNPVTTKCPECWYQVPIEDETQPGDEYECENCGEFLTLRSNRPLELDRYMGHEVRTAGPPPEQCPIYEGMQINLLDHVRIVNLIDKVKLWGYSRIDLHITLTDEDENYATVVIRKLS